MGEGSESERSRIIIAEGESIRFPTSSSILKSQIIKAIGVDIKENVVFLTLRKFRERVGKMPQVINQV